MSDLGVSPKRRRLSLLARSSFFLLTVVAAATMASNDDPRDYLNRMGPAVEELNYYGILLHLHEGDLTVLRIVHRVEGGRVNEKISAMDGEGREIIRDNDEVTCVLPDQKIVMVEPRDIRDSNQSPLTGRLPDPAAFDDAYYDLEFLGEGRTAGRQAVIIAVQPMDGFRYGYRLWLDRATSMPLKSQLRNDANEVVEQISFADITLPESIPIVDVQPSMGIDSFTWQRTETPADSKSFAAVENWRATQMPAGFELTAARSKFAAGSSRPMEHLVYSDGLASVSVFIEMGVAESEQTEGLTPMGSVNAFTTTLNGRLVTAMGQVPAQTVEMIALSVRSSSGTP